MPSFKRIQCLDRAIDILAVIADEHPATVQDIALRVGLNPSTAYNIVKTLESRGLISNDAGRYAVGATLGLMASSWDVSGSLPMLTRPIFELYRSTVGEAACLATLRGQHAELLNLVDHAGQVGLQFVHRTWNYPLNLGVGRLLVALGDPADYPHHIERQLRDGPRNQGEKDWDFPRWLAHLESLRDQDSVILRIVPGDGADPIGVVAIPLRTTRGALLGAIGSSCQLDRASDGHLLEMRTALAEAIAKHPI
jgi:DNA-binding IclR family transcriptional regulator